MTWYRTSLWENWTAELKAQQAERARAGYINELKEENARLREALKRLGSSEAMTLPFFPDTMTKEGKELMARIDYARKTPRSLKDKSDD